MFKRRRFKDLPKTIGDMGCFLFLFFFIPLTFVFELCVVMPEFHAPGSFMYILTWIAGLFVTFNIVGNWLACFVVDSSIKASILTTPSDSSARKHWHLCSQCEAIAPPRSWHCDSCNTCILKRDHHCLFAANCIGHRNQRYFILFVLYSIFGCLYALIYNSLYFLYLNADIYLNIETTLKMVCPVIGLMWELSWKNFYLFIFEMNIIALIYCVILVMFHVPNILKGAVTFDRENSRYDFGWKSNVEMVLGKRWHLAWLSPLLKSELPHDGIHWEVLLKQSAKNR